MGSFPKADQIVEESAINRISPAFEQGASSARPMEAPNELWEWLRLLNRRKALIIGCGLVATALMALVIAQATPLYKASSRIMLDTRTFKVMSTEAALSGVDTLNIGAIQSELEVIQSEFLIGRVVDKLGLANNSEFNGTKPPGFVENALAPIRELWHSGLTSLFAPAPQGSAGRAGARRPRRGQRPAATGRHRRRGGSSQRDAARPHLRHPGHRRKPRRHHVGPHRQRDRRGLSRGPDRHQERGEPAGDGVARAAPGRAPPQPPGRRRGGRRLSPRQGPGRQPRGRRLVADAVRAQREVQHRARPPDREGSAPRRAQQGEPQSRRTRQHPRGLGQYDPVRRCASRTSS